MDNGEVTQTFMKMVPRGEVLRGRTKDEKSKKTKGKYRTRRFCIS